MRAMRGLTKLAALLSATPVSAFVIPTSFETRPSGGVIDYKPSEASLEFTINDVPIDWPHPVFELHVSEADRACGESHVELNGQQLESTWDGIEAHGHGFLDVYDGREATWSITCLYDSIPSDGSFSNGDDVVHLLRLSFLHSAQGFAVSYKQHGKPAIVRFSPDVVDSAQIDGEAGKWRQPSLDFDQDIPINRRPEEGPSTSTKKPWHKPQSLLSSVSAFQKLLTDKLRKIFCCPKNKTHPQTEKANPLAVVPFVPLGNETRSIDETPGTPDNQATTERPKTTGTPETDVITDYDEIGDSVSTPTIKNTDSTNTARQSSAAETRSLHYPEELVSPTPASGPSPSISALQTGPDHRLLKVIGLVLFLFALLIWCILRWTDPRWRADRAARREERRNKRLYKRAARKHKINTWLWKFRLKFNLVSNEVLSWDEKRARVTGQEEVLENVMKNDIRALRNAHRVVSDMTAAEEGRTGFDFDAEGSERRRSVTTLPGYESESSQPPSYEASRSFESTTLAGSSILTPADIDSNPDSSVVSTSPRISRDGTNSDFDEKIEVLSLEPDHSTDTYAVCNRI